MSDRKKQPQSVEPTDTEAKRPEGMITRIVTSLIEEGEASARKIAEVRERIRSGARVTKHRFRI
jgi:hypothetical protein